MPAPVATAMQQLARTKFMSFGLTVPEGTPVRLSPREHSQALWLPWREAADRCFSPSNAEAILHLPRLSDVAGR